MVKTLLPRNKLDKTYVPSNDEPSDRNVLFSVHCIEVC